MAFDEAFDALASDARQRPGELAERDGHIADADVGSHLARLLYPPDELLGQPFDRLASRQTLRLFTVEAPPEHGAERSDALCHRGAQEAAQRLEGVPLLGQCPLGPFRDPLADGMQHSVPDRAPVVEVPVEGRISDPCSASDFIQGRSTPWTTTASRAALRVRSRSRSAGE